MKIKLLSIVLATFILVGLIGCAANEQVSPTIFVRASDGAQITTGMHRDYIENILEIMSEEDKSILEPSEVPYRMGLYGDANNFIRINYNGDGVAWSIGIWCRDWTVAGGISIGDNIQRVINNRSFEYIEHSEWTNSYGVLLEDEENLTILSFLYNEERNIRLIMLYSMYYAFSV